MSSRKQAFVDQAEETIPEEDELDEDEYDEFPLGFEDDGDDDGEILSAFLTTEDGDNIATVLHDALAGITKAMNIQNQILVKILTQLSRNNSN